MAELGAPREEYGADQLHEHEVAGDPLVQLRAWLDEAIAAALPEPTAMTLATVDADGRPDARVVLLRGLDDRGLRWYTNRASAKGQQLAVTRAAAVVLHWQPLERQVRVRGTVEELPAAESDAYFAARPRESQLGAWASDQSTPIVDRAALDAQVAAVERRFGDGPIPRPPHWGGYLLRPSTIEFWQGRPARLHDRILHTRAGDGWTLVRLQP